MKATETKLKGVFVLEPQVFGDERGWFMESWSQRKMEEAGIDFSKPVIMATPTARLEYKVLPAPTMKSLLKKIIDTTGAQIIFNFVNRQKERRQQYVLRSNLYHLP